MLCSHPLRSIRERARAGPALDNPPYTARPLSSRAYFYRSFFRLGRIIVALRLYGGGICRCSRARPPARSHGAPLCQEARQGGSAFFTRPPKDHVRAAPPPLPHLSNSSIVVRRSASHRLGCTEVAACSHFFAPASQFFFFFCPSSTAAEKKKKYDRRRRRRRKESPTTTTRRRSASRAARPAAGVRSSWITRCLLPPPADDSAPAILLLFFSPDAPALALSLSPSLSLSCVHTAAAVYIAIDAHRESVVAYARNCIEPPHAWM